MLERKHSTKSSIVRFFRNVKSLYAAALGIEILCIASSGIGENTGLYLLGFNHIGVPLAYVMGYALSVFTTFATIFGKYKYGSGGKVDNCRSVLGQDDNKGFSQTWQRHSRTLHLAKRSYKRQNMKDILRASFVILLTAETAFIITAETVDLIFYKHYLYLSIPLALFAGAFTVVAPEAYKKLKRRN